MSVQKLRTPKGLAQLAAMTGRCNSNAVLLAMQRLQNLYAGHRRQSRQGPSARERREFGLRLRSMTPPLYLNEKHQADQINQQNEGVGL
jgi:hypothetical protein